jgi:hypothetical protein
VKHQQAAARFFAETFGLSYNPAGDPDHFAPVRVNDALTLRFDNAHTIKSRHDALYVSDAEFDAIFTRVKRAGLVDGRHAMEHHRRQAQQLGQPCRNENRASCQSFSPFVWESYAIS